MYKIDDLPVELQHRWQPKKKQSKKLSSIYNRIGYAHKSESVSNCGHYLKMGVYDDGSVRLDQAIFCKDILCPMCQWRKELKLFHQVQQVVNLLKNDYQFLFVTLTLKNCPADGDALTNTLDHLNKSFTKLLRRKEIKSILSGCFKSIEVTYNKDTDEFHPHLHCIFVVCKNYFASANYLTQKRLSELWQSCLKVDYIPIVDIRKIGCKKVLKNGKCIVHDLSSAVAEVCKYSVKSVDYLQNSDSKNDQIVLALVSAFYHKRLYQFYGIMADTRRLLNQDDVDDGDLVHIDDDNNNDAKLLYYLTFVWSDKCNCYINDDVQIVDDVIFNLRC